MSTQIQLHHGDGGKHTNSIISNIFYKYFDNAILTSCQDSAVLSMKNEKIAFTTDSFVVKPLFFKGGDIGKLAVCGTVNDLAATGAVPLYLSAGFIIEEGFELELLDKIARSMGEMCRAVGARIVTGDTKVVEKGFADGVYINTSGIGVVNDLYQPRQIEPGDEILVTGSIAEHGTVVLVERYNLGLQGNFQSDCSPLCNIITGLKEDLSLIKLMRDPTRGGLATALCEIAGSQGKGILVKEEKIPVSKCVQAVHGLLGTDPLYFASEGRMILVVEKGYGESILSRLRKLDNCRNAEIIGAFDEDFSRMVRMITPIGGERILTMLENQMIPRIC